MSTATSQEVDEETALLPSPSSDNNKTTKCCNDSSSRSSFLINRFLILILLALLVAVSIFFQLQVRDLSNQLQQEKSRTDSISKLLGVHEEVIERFNSSVTNSDVLSRLDSLERNFTSATKRVEHELNRVQKDVSNQLDQTLKQLSTTVEKAEKEISEEVDRVKADVEQYVVTTQDQFSIENSFMVYQIAGTFTLLSCLISMWHMTAHLRRMNQPDVQRKILAILWMAPIYAVTSWFSLVFPAAEGYLAIIKDGYEAYIIYQFLAFCIAVLGKGDRNVVVDLLARRADHLTPPFRLCGCFEMCGCCVPEPYENNRALADAVLLQCQVFCMQFVFLRPLITTAMVVLDKLQYYGAGDGPTDYRSPQFYLTILQNISIFVAFAGLLKFYHAVDSDLAWCRPFAKFLCIKGVVFMTFWQGLAISILAQTTQVGGDKDSSEWAKQAQNFLICLEMLLFSIAHFYCFPTEEWEEGYRVKHSQGAFGDSIALGDFFQDIKLILKSNSDKKKKKKKPEQPPIPEGDEDTEAVSVATSDEDEKTERAVAEALEESLGLVGDDPDIIEAKKRLLESKVLQPDFFECGSDDYYDLSATNSRDDNSVEDDAEEDNSEEDEVNKDSNEEDGIPSESTALLSHAHGSSDDMLKPSIFTTVASIAAAQENQEDEENTKPETDTV